MTERAARFEKYIDKAKSGGTLSKDELTDIIQVFYGPIEVQSYESLLAFALVFPFEQDHLDRYKDLFACFRQHDTIETNLSDRSAAVITAVCNYWSGSALFEAELRTVLKDWPWEDWPDTCIRAASSFGGLIYENQSEAMFGYLKKIASDKFDYVEALEKEVLARSLIAAIIGFRKSPKKLASQIKTKSDIKRLSLDRRP
ncbi:hypothetical protein ATO10_05452 [Actibacterium atlanticum]|uniref:Uncharacterized protein n=1 Tax=Actibacterium atlanticum TaxID=1461693 RepID=A0A058ZP71_9RHOB|nr:hypothetical protein [Actibacterium atlanticum]KCV83030.1 hypothetical protein ATO10_05452 [Actibacterium atlanticum]